MSNSSASANRCPQCGAELAHSADGLCPRCLMAQIVQPTQTDGPAASLPPLSPAELAPHFPQLEILECLGRGGMGVVYKARQKSLNRLVALKLLAPERASDGEFAKRFTREAHALAALNHPHIVTIYDFGRAGGFYFLLMEFVDGVNLRQAMTANRFTPEQALTVVPPICEALQYAHEQGIVHRDIKPENLLLDKGGRVKIADFGIAKMLGEDSNTGVAESQPAGTPQYMAPEQKEHQRTDHRADIYSLGVVLYEMLTGELPADQLQPPSRRVTIDVRLDEIVLRALEKTPELRYQTAGEFRTQLETVTHPSPIERDSPADARRWRRAPAVVFSLLYAALVWFVVSSSLLLPARPPTHFDLDGHPNGWMNRSTYVLWTCAFPLLLLGLFRLVSWSARWCPSLVNIPRRDYWLAPERRVETAALLFRWLLWLACGLTVFFGALHELILEANRLSPPRLPSGPLLLVVMAFLLGLMIWIVSFITRLAEAGHRPGAERPSGDHETEPATGGDRLFHGLGFHRKSSQRFLLFSLLGFLGFFGCRPGGEWMLWFLCCFGFLFVAARIERSADRAALTVEAALQRRHRRAWVIALLIVAGSIAARVWLLGQYVVPGNSAAPEIPAGSRILVWKVTRSFSPGDMAAYRHGDNTFVGRVVRASREEISVSRNGQADEVLPPSQLIGKVISVYWRGESNPVSDASPSSPIPVGHPPVEPREQVLKRLTPGDPLLSSDIRWVQEGDQAPSLKLDRRYGDELDRQLAELLKDHPEADPAVTALRQRIAERGHIPYPRVIRLYEVRNPDVEACTVLYRAKLKTKDLKGRAYLEMWCRFPHLGEAFSRGLDQTLSGSSDWVSCQIPFFLQKGQKPDLIKLNVVVDGEGEISARDIELVAVPAMKTP